MIVKGIDKKRIISINFDDFINKKLKDIDSLFNYISSQIDENNMNYIFLDEIQEVPNFEEVVNSFYKKDNTDIYYGIKLSSFIRRIGNLSNWTLCKNRNDALIFF